MAWRTYGFDVNGLPVAAWYREETVEQVLAPLLVRLASPAFASQSRRRGAVRGFHRIARGIPYRRLGRVCISRRDVHLADDIRSRHVAVPVAIAYAHRVAEMGL